MTIEEFASVLAAYGQAEFEDGMCGARKTTPIQGQALLEAFRAEQARGDSLALAKRELQSRQYEQPWTVNEAAQERQRRETAEARIAELEAKVLGLQREVARLSSGGYVDD